MAIRTDLIVRWVLAGAVLLAIPTFLLLPNIAFKPWPLPLPRTSTTIQLDYHELLPADGDMSAVRNKIYAQVQKDCEGAAKAFQKQCMVNALTFNDPRGEDSEGPSIVSGHAELTLYGDNKAAARRAPR